MPLIEGSRSKNVLANSESSDLLNEENIPNGEDTAEKAKNINNTEVSGGFQIQIIARLVLVYQLYVTEISSYFQSQNILDLLDVVPPSVTPANPAPPPAGGADDLLDLLGDVATISNPGTFTLAVLHEHVYMLYCVGWVMQSLAYLL